jgi:hypothetical protein
MRGPVVAGILVCWSSIAGAQTIAQRGFIDGRVFGFPQTAPTDATQAVGDILFREEVFLRPSRWIQFATGLDLRGNSHAQTEEVWRLDFSDRGVRRPRAGIRRLTATLTAGHFTLDAGKQFIRWGRADILNPTDRFAPRDFLNVLDADFLPVLGVRPSLQFGQDTFEGVWVPRLTPSRLPLVDQRWTVSPPGAGGAGGGTIRDAGSDIPHGSQWGVRWRHAGGRVEAALSYFDGFNHLPNIQSPPPGVDGVVEITRVYPALRMYGADLALPTRLVTFKSEAAYFMSPSSTNDEYVLYVIELERQAGEWILDVGYAGEAVTTARESFRFAPDRGLARSILGRASYTVDPRRTVTIEGAARQSRAGFYAKGEYSEAFGQHWRLTLGAVGITGAQDDFLGQFRRNSNASIAFRFSF